MKIAITGYDHLDSLARNLYVTFQNLGHSVHYVDDLPGMHYETRWLRLMVSLLLHHPAVESYRSKYVARRVIARRPDVFVSVWSWLTPSAVRMIRDAGIRAVLIFPDHMVNLGRQYALLAPYNLLFFKDPYMVRFATEKAGLPAYYLPEACNPMWHRPVALSDQERERYQCDVTTASNMYPYRLRLLEVLDGYDMKLWGPPWPIWLESPLHRYYAGAGVRELEKAKAFRAAKICVNTLHYGEVEGVNCRTFEVAGCGGFQITDWRPALPELFQPDREIVTYASREELREKVDYYLRHDDERERIAEAGCVRAHRDHTYEVRIRQVLELLGNHV